MIGTFFAGRRLLTILVIASGLGITTASVGELRGGFADFNPLSGLKALVFPAGSQQAKVMRVKDGDTYVVDIDGKSQTVRILGIDTPESVKPHTPIRCFGKRASHVSARRLTGKTVTLTYDVERKDKYGRTLAYVELGGKDYGAWMLRHGYARTLSIKPNTNRAGEYSGLEETAQRKNKGLWGACKNAFPDG